MSGNGVLTALLLLASLSDVRVKTLTYLKKRTTPKPRGGPSTSEVCYSAASAGIINSTSTAVNNPFCMAALNCHCSSAPSTNLLCENPQETQWQAFQIGPRC